MRSILSARIDELTAKFIDSTNYVDLNMTGTYIDESGNVEVSLLRDKALVNGVKMWMLSREGDYYREPEKGGILDLLLGTPLDEEYSQNLKSEISTKFNAQFSLVQLVDLNVGIDNQLGVWKLYYKVLDVLNKKIVDFNVNVQV